MDRGLFSPFACGKAKPGPHLPGVPFWRASAALQGRLQKIDVVLKTNESFCPEAAWAPAPNAKQLLRRQFQSTKGSGPLQWPLGTAPSLPESHKKDLNVQEKNPQGIWLADQGVQAVTSPLRRSLLVCGGHGGNCCAGGQPCSTRSWKIILGGCSSGFSLQDPLPWGPIPGVSPAVFPPALLLAEPVQSRAEHPQG